MYRMPYAPATSADVQDMCDAIGVESAADLFAEIPRDLRFPGELDNEAPQRFRSRLNATTAEMLEINKYSFYEYVDL